MYSALNFLTLAALLPLASALFLWLSGRRLGRAAAYIATTAVAAALGLSLATLIVWVAGPQFNQTHYAEAVTCRWLPVHDPPQLRIAEGINAMNPMEATLALRQFERENNRRNQGLQLGLMVDTLTIAMFLTVSMIATFIHIYTVAALAGNPRQHHFFAWLNLLCFAMFGLALANNLLQLLAFLELLGVCAYMLISFVPQRQAPAAAASKTLLLHVLGATAFLIGAGTLAAQSAIGMAGLTFFAGGPDMVGTPVLEHQVLVAIAAGAPADVLYFTSAPQLLGLSWLTWAGICLFGGALICSAQFPLHVWLVAAAEGPTPALAMLGSVGTVAAGAFVVARLYGIFTLDARLFIATIGCLSFAAGALLALVQTHLKRLLAYSSVSHLGLVMLFFGAGAYVAALFVMVVHAFCKACLFLAAGSVLQSCRGETQLRRLGGLWKRLPITAGTFLLAMLSLCGTPWLAGFFAQGMGLDTLHKYALALPGSYGPLLWWIPALTLFITAFYMWRCWWLVFGGRARDPELDAAAHENPLLTLLLILLAGLTVVASYLDIDNIVAKSVPAAALVVTAPHPDPLEAIGTPAGWAGVLAALCIMLLHVPGPNLADRGRRLPGLNLLYIWLSEDMFLEDLYDGVIARLFRWGAQGGTLIDRYLLDGWLHLLVRGATILAAATGALEAHLVAPAARRLVVAVGLVKRRPAELAAPAVTEKL